MTNNKSNKRVSGIQRTRKNKLCATLLIAVGIASTMVEKDITFLVFAGCIGIPLFFAKENWMY